MNWGYRSTQVIALKGHVAISRWHGGSVRYGVGCFFGTLKRPHLYVFADWPGGEVFKRLVGPSEHDLSTRLWARVADWTDRHA